MPKVTSPTHIDLATLRWRSVQRPSFKDRFLHLMPKQQLVGQLGSIGAGAFPSGVRLIQTTFAPPRANTPSIPNDPLSPANPFSIPNDTTSGFIPTATNPPNGATTLIPKPANLTSGRFETYLQWSSDDYAAIKATIKDLAEKFLDLKLPLKDQSKEQLASLREKARAQYSLLARYKDDWATYEFLQRLLKNTSSRSKPKRLGTVTACPDV